MDTTWIPLQSIPQGGKTLVFNEPALWQTPIDEFGLMCRILTPIHAEILVLPQEEGVLFRGKITGTLSLPCDRCTEDSTVTLAHRFDSFEPYPAEPLPLNRKAGGAKKAVQAAAEDEEAETLMDDADQAVIRNAAHGRGVEINPWAMVWQEFSLALPVKPLCGAGCKGLCPACGANRNSVLCSCVEDTGDPRMAALRGLQVKTKP